VTNVTLDLVTADTASIRPWSEDAYQERRCPRGPGGRGEVDVMAEKQVTPKKPSGSKTKSESAEAQTRVTKRLGKKLQKKVAKRV
jgi:hypothetical protein